MARLQTASVAQYMSMVRSSSTEVLSAAVQPLARRQPEVAGGFMWDPAERRLSTTALFLTIQRKGAVAGSTALPAAI